MPSYDISGAYGDATVDGVGPFAVGQTGGVNGALAVVNGDGTPARLSIDPNPGNTVFAETAANITLLTTIAGDAEDARLVDAPVNTVAPAITGTAQVGVELTVSDGTWTTTDAQDAPTFAYEWFADGVEIPGDHTNKFTPTDSEEGALITAQVTATNSHGPVSKLSAATAAVAAAA